jgi:hypothetical protein
VARLGERRERLLYPPTPTNAEGPARCGPFASGV